MGSHTLSSGDSGRELGVGDIEPVFGSRVWLSVYGDCGYGDCVWFCGQACHRQWHEELGSEYDLGMADKPVTGSGVRNWVVNMTLAWQTSLSQAVV